eukprot:Platyproteum_vivax@DN7659_c2_g1_i1.p1
MVRKPLPDVVDLGENNAALKMLEKQMKALENANQKIGSLQTQLQEGLETQKCGIWSKIDKPNCSEEFQKLHEAFKTMEQAQSEKELRFDSMCNHFVVGFRPW